MGPKTSSNPIQVNSKEQEYPETTLHRITTRKRDLCFRVEIESLSSEELPMEDMRKTDPFLMKYQPSDLKITSEFLTTWLPYLSRDLCENCTQILSDRIRALDPEGIAEVEIEGLNSEKNCCDDNALDDDDDTNSLGSWKEGGRGVGELVAEGSSSTGVLGGPSRGDTGSSRMSWADMAQEEDELAEEEEEPNEGTAASVSEIARIESNRRNSNVGVVEKPKLSRDKREYIRFMNVKRRRDFMCFEKIKGKLVNIAEGLELHTGVFSAAEQKRIVNFVYDLQEKGKNGELKDRTYSAPRKWMRGKGRVTIQFGCCYNYAMDKDGNPPGILRDDTVDPLPPLFKVIIRRLIKWHVLPPTCVPDSCIVNIYEEGDCIPPHIDNHDFVRPFCTVSFLSQCIIVFGSDLKVLGPGEFSGEFFIPLPVGSVLVLNGNGADVAKHCVPSVPTKRISITFRKMDVTKQPHGHVPEPDLQGIQPLQYEEKQTKSSSSPRSEGRIDRHPTGREGRARGFAENNSHSEPHHSYRSRRGPYTKRWGNGS